MTRGQLTTSRYRRPVPRGCGAVVVGPHPVPLGVHASPGPVVTVITGMSAVLRGGLAPSLSLAQSPRGDRVPRVGRGIRGGRIPPRGVIIAYLSIVIAPVRGPVTAIRRPVTHTCIVIAHFSVTLTLVRLMITSVCGLLTPHRSPPTWGVVVTGEGHDPPSQRSKHSRHVPRADHANNPGL